MKAIHLMLAGLLFAAPAFAQNCSSVVTADEAGVLKDTTAIQKSASTLIDQGVDPHIVTLGTLHAGETLSQAALLTAGYCNWLVNNRTTYKPNLLLLVVAPSAHKKNAFFGSALAPAFENAGNVDYIYSQAANPFFKSGDFAGGLSAAFRDFGAKNAAYHDQQKHPTVAQTTVNNQATDLSGLWTFFKWLLTFAIFGSILFVIWRLYRRHGEDQAAVDTAQGDAVDARDRATKAYNQKPTGFEQRFLELSQSVSNDPTAQGLTEVQYRRIQRAWNTLYNDITNTSYKPSKLDPYAGISTPIAEPNVTARAMPAAFGAPYGATPIPVAVPATPIVVHDNSNDLLTGVLVGEAISRNDEPRYDPDPPVHHKNEDSDSGGGFFSSIANSLSSGSDSSWGSSDSSSSFDSGSSSSYDSGSSSSDFSSGSDSSW